MSFGIGKNNRPEGTEELEEGVIHYTCNAPSNEVLAQAGIQQLGSRFGVADNEVVLIPHEQFDSRGLPKDIVEAEKILRDLE